MIIDPYLSLSPIYNGSTIWCYNTSILTNQDIDAIKNVICHPILDAICTVVWVWATLSCSLCDRLPLSIKDIAAFPKQFPLHSIRTVLLY
ncbi:unknown [Bacteroides sp. CAG:770]|nr:unknown [Bacteroides sp. CAG:770]